MEREEYRRLFELEDHLWWFAGMRAISLTLLDRFLGPPVRSSSRELRILDAGCGTGGMLPHLGRYGRVVGCDISAHALGFAQRRREGYLVRGSLLRLPFSPQSFDVVTSFDVIYHQAIPDDEQALAEMARVLRPRGTLLLRVPAHDRLRSGHDRAVHTRHRYSRKELHQKLRRAGLRPVFLTYANGLLFPVALVKRLGERLLPDTNEGSEVKPVSRSLNCLLTSVLRLEALALRHVRLPIGLSVVAVAERDATAV